MSRSALWHQEKNVNRRNKEAEEIWEAAVEEGRNNRARNLIELSGPDDGFRLEPMLLNAIQKSQYFLKLCREISTWNALVDEIYYKADSIEPWALDSPYIRAIGFLYLRYTCDPHRLFHWFQPYLFDPEPIPISAHSKKAQRDTTIGSLVRSLVSSNRDFYGTMLPRLPAQIEREIQVQLLHAETIEKRAEAHFRDKRTMEIFQKLGSKVMATYQDEENPLQWYHAEVDRVVTRGEDGNPLKYPKFVVTFTEYGNTETVHLGEMDLPNGRFFKEGLGGGRGGGGGRDNNRLYDEVRRRERETVTADRRGDYYARRPPSTKELQMSAGGRKEDGRSRRRSPSPETYRRRSPPREAGARDGGDKRGGGAPPPRKRTAEEQAAIQEKKRKLMAKYG